MKINLKIKKRRNGIQKISLQNKVLFCERGYAKKKLFESRFFIGISSFSGKEIKQ